MSLNHSMILKTREIRFSHSLLDGDREALEIKLARCDGLSKINFMEKRLTVDYQFPLLNFESILEIINSNTNITNFSLFNRIKNKLTNFMEENEQDYLNFQCGWDHYVEDINIQYFEFRHKDNAYKHR